MAALGDTVAKFRNRSMAGAKGATSGRKGLSGAVLLPIVITQVTLLSKPFL